MATKSLYVGNLPYSTTESGLMDAFSAYGASQCRIVEGRGFGFVDVDADKLEAAIADMHNKSMDGRTLTVNEARPREPRSNSGGGGGYGGGRSSGGGRNSFGGGKNRW